MSSRRSRKTANPRAKAPEPIITRTKSRELRNKEAKKTEKPELTKPETKSTKVVKTVKRSQESLLKVPIVIEPDDDIQVEYFPNTLKRDVRTKKIMLKPKHNFKVIAATNKRKMATPQKGTKPPSKQNAPQTFKSLRCSKTSASTSPELSMQDMVRMMDETRSLSDEDFMEILTCPSPVWWEDPPDGGFDDDSIHTRSPDPPSAKVAKQNKKRKLTSSIASRNSNNTKRTTVEHYGDLSDEKFKTKDEKFVKKKQKLENILGNIKKKTIEPKNDVNNDTNNRKLSESEGDFSDLSFNEEEILKNLEEMEIPMQQTPTESNHSLDINSETNDTEIKEQVIEIQNNEIESKNENLDREILSIEIKKEFKDEFLIRSPVFANDGIFAGSEFHSSDEISSIKKSDDIVTKDSCTNFSLSKPSDLRSVVDLDCNSNSGIRTKSVKENDTNEIVPPKKTKDLSEFITVYKITPDKLKIGNDSEKSILPENTNKMSKIETVRGKLNDFFKQCKSNIRLKKLENSIPAIPLTDVKEATDNKKKDDDTKIDLEDEKNRLKSCDYCIEQTEKGTSDFACEKCEMAPILPCGLCNFVADTKEVYKNHVSSCKDGARISWSHNYVLNQT